jgi:tripartite-type tricarboxylate transporter receptor subunit TctC
MKFLAWLFCLVVASPAFAQDAYPNKPVRVLVPYGPGGATDIIARIVAAKLTESLGQSFVVENRPGANGNIALEAAAKAAPDGYTLLVGNVSTNAINESMYAGQLSIRPSRDLVAITKLVEIPHIVVANAAFPANNIAELVALAKKEPGRINYTSAGMGSYPHLDMERFMKASGTQMTHVPYKGGAGQAIPAMVAGEVQLAFFNMASLLPHIKSGRLKALAAIPEKRLPELPDVPTLAEQGVSGADIQTWYAMYVTAGTPRAAVERLAAELTAALKLPDVQARIKGLGGEIQLMSPEQFAEMNKNEFERYGKLVRDANIKPEGQ